MQIVEIGFLDTTTCDHWMLLGDVTSLKCSSCRARGLLVKETDNLVYIASLDRTDSEGNIDIVSGVVVIPKGAVVSRRVVEE